MDALRSGEVPARKLRLSQRSAIMPGAFYRDGNRLRVQALEAVMRSGGSVIVEAIQPPTQRSGRCARRSPSNWASGSLPA